MRQRHDILAFAARAVALAAVLSLSGCGSDGGADPAPRSLSYRGHESNSDSDILVAVYPGIVGTRLDDCQTCHAGGLVTYSSGKKSSMNPCSYCHLIPYPDPAIVSGAPAGYAGTLNAYGADYGEAGRNRDGVAAIAGLDSDGDAHVNQAEFADLRYPGDAGSRPGLPTIPVRTFTADEVQDLPGHHQFLLLNSHKQQFDTYADYAGTCIRDVLVAAGADLENATSITCIAPDGFAKDFPLTDVEAAFPAGIFYGGLDPGSHADPDQGFVEYPSEDVIPDGLTQGGTIPGEPWLLLAWERDELPMDHGNLDPVSGQLNGEGPYRLVVPQRVPGPPDRGSGYSPSGYADGYDFDPAADHNAGSCVRALVAIRVNPIPEGYEEFDWKNGGWALVEQKHLIVYGAGVEGN